MMVLCDVWTLGKYLQKGKLTTFTDLLLWPLPVTALSAFFTGIPRPLSQVNTRYGTVWSKVYYIYPGVSIGKIYRPV